MPLVDAQGTIFGVCAGHPADADWQSVSQAAADALKTRRHRCHVPLSERRDNRRGDFINLSSGVSHGGGQKFPKNLSHSTRNAQVLEELNGMECFKRLAGFGSNVMATWVPDLHDHYSDRLGKLFRHNRSLKRNFVNSVFPAVTYNMGPQIVCMKHIDFSNLAFGWCAITALGSYNPKLGGHLVLWDCGLVIEFPPGTTILIPSAVLAHSNTAVMEGETRYSFTQYAAGGLFRWVENGFKKENIAAREVGMMGFLADVTEPLRMISPNARRLLSHFQSSYSL
ncbi:hypothetical protein CPC08DRAFT_738774 [Agrocybe pediades]|nr:hypothetical protein CPC08DRAFT_738774 [Agrocybe pediades]